MEGSPRRGCAYFSVYPVRSTIRWVETRFDAYRPSATGFFLMPIDGSACFVE